MRKRISEGSFDNRRMLSVTEAQEYSGLGRTQLRSLAENSGAVKRCGRRVLIDRIVLDRALDALPGTAASAEQ